MALKRSSTAIDDRNWCYDEPDGLQIVHQVVSESGAVLWTDFVTVPWTVLRAALYRHDKRKQPRTTRKTVRR